MDYLELIKDKKGKDLIDLQCPICEKTFQKTKSYIRDKVVNKGFKAFYCSRGCVTKKQRTGMLKQCSYCNKEIYKIQSQIREQNFCSKKCSGLYYGSLRESEGTKNCVCCGSLMQRKSGTKYCSKECYHNHRHKLKKEVVIKTGILHSSNMTDMKSSRNYLITENGYCCTICGIEEWQGEPVPLVLDHIDGDSTNGSVSNCRMICRNCDGLLPTYAGRNLGNGRKWRREYRKKNGQY